MKNIDEVMHCQSNEKNFTLNKRKTIYRQPKRREKNNNDKETVHLKNNNNKIKQTVSIEIKDSSDVSDSKETLYISALVYESATTFLRFLLVAEILYN